jgi:glyoxylase-like metal-dependent hydrolase (beta-lactamase superfamily II)
MSAVTYLYDQPPEFGEVFSIRDGLSWVRLPLPFALDHVNCWLLENDADTCLIDTGVANNKTIAFWQRLLESSDNNASQINSITTLLVTHFHPDHSGLAGWFQNKGARIITSEIEWQLLQSLYQLDDDAYQTMYMQWYARNGINKEAIDRVGKAGNAYRKKVGEPPDDVNYLRAGDKVQLANNEYTVLIGRGHAPDMLMLFCEQQNVLIAADQILPSITPNVSLTPRSVDQNPLASFLHSISALKALPENTLVLPSHGLPFTGLHARIDQLTSHHAQRCEQIMQELQYEKTAAELFPLLFRRELDDQQLSFALGEALAHIRYLEMQSLVTRVDKNGVDYFCST